MSSNEVGNGTNQIPRTVYVDERADAKANAKLLVEAQARIAELLDLADEANAALEDAVLKEFIYAAGCFFISMIVLVLFWINVASGMQ